MTDIVSAIEHQLRERPSDLAVTVLDDDDRLTYEQLDASSAAVARRLRGLGVGPDVVVAVHGTRRPATIAAILGVLRSGGAYLPIDPAAPPSRVAHMLEQARACAVLAPPEIAASVPAGPWAVVALDRSGCSRAEPLSASTARPRGRANSPEDLAYVLFTSGSTGMPKGVLVTRSNLFAYVDWAAAAYGFLPGGRTLVHSPLAFDFTVTTMFGPLVTGGTLVLVPQDDPEVLAHALARTGGYDVIKLTPTHLELLGRRLRDTDLAGTAATVVIGGEALFHRQLEPWRRAAPTTLFVNEYGPTEATVGCAVHVIRPNDPFGEGPVPIGDPAAGAELLVLDTDGHPVGPGAIGELHIGGPGVARGYTMLTGDDADRFVTIPPHGRRYRTGDLARRSPEGLVYVGRMDDQVKIRGHRVELAEVERALLAHPGIAAVAVSAPERRPGGRRLVAYVVLAGEQIAVEALRAHAISRLPAPMVPASFVVLDELPTNANGKVDRRALPTPGRERPHLEAPYAPARSGLEAALVQLWCEVLELASVGIHDSFLDLGGDSLLAAEVSARADEELGLDLSVNDLFDELTIERVAVRVAQSREAIR